MSSHVAGIIAEIIAALRKWGAALFAFLAGRAAEKKENELEQSEAEVVALEKRLEREREIARRRDDDDERDRVRDAYTRPPGK